MNKPTKNFLRLLIALFLLQPMIGYAQNIDQKVFAAQGNYNHNEDMSLSWTLGDAFIETIYTGHAIITQGFQQAFVQLRKLPDSSKESLEVMLYPNPTSGFLTLQVQGEQSPLEYELLDSGGKLIVKGSTDSGIRDFDISPYPAGKYFLRIKGMHEQKASLFEIIKL